eukprot:28882-Chlamydomonas_euryale.AAC.3
MGWRKPDSRGNHVRGRYDERSGMVSSSDADTQHAPALSKSGIVLATWGGGDGVLASTVSTAAAAAPAGVAAASSGSVA